MITEAIQHYHDLLAGGMAETTHDVMQEELAKRRLFFGSLPVCRVMRPHFYMPDQWEFLAVRTKIVLRALISCIKRAWKTRPSAPNWALKSMRKNCWTAIACACVCLVLVAVGCLL